MRWAVVLAAIVAALAGHDVARGQSPYEPLCQALATCVPPAPPSAPPLAPPARPNIVFVLTDDLSTDLLRRMPEVRRLQRDGVSFSRYIVSNSLCCPSRSTILTGRLPHNSGVMTNLPPFGGYDAFMGAGNQSSTFASSLQATGYRTALMGKFLNGYRATEHPPLVGFDEWDATAAGYRQLNYTLNENGHPVFYGEEPESFFNTVLTRKAGDFIDMAAGLGIPFILEIASVTPHAPFTTEEQDRGGHPFLRVPRSGAFNKANLRAPSWLAGRPALNFHQRARMDRVYRKRARAVQSVDRMLGALRYRLAAAGIADRTYVVFSSDNGFHTGEHRLLIGKQTAFDHDVKVPLIVAGPGIPPGRATEVLAQNSDLRPTFEAMAAQTPSGDVDGVSLLPWLQNPDLGGGRGTALIEHRHEAPNPLADPDAQTRAAGNPPDYTAMRLPGGTYVEYGSGEREFYDTVADPHQRDNRYDLLSPETQASLAQRLADLRTCVGAAACAAP